MRWTDYLDNMTAWDAGYEMASYLTTLGHPFDLDGLALRVVQDGSEDCPGWLEVVGNIQEGAVAFLDDNDRWEAYGAMWYPSED